MPDLTAVPGCSVDRFDEATGHVVALLESETLAGQEQGLGRLQALPGVLGAAVAAHHFDAPSRFPHKEPDP